MDFFNKSVISISEFTKEELNFVIEKTMYLKKESIRGLLKTKIIALLFFEPSTRTRLSFETAILKQDGKIIGFSSSDSSSTRKGESFKDTIKTVSGYADIIIVRHKIEGASRVAAEIQDKPVINAGDGANQHPTQTFLDLFTIYEFKGTIDGLKIGIMGDLKYGRAVHSLVNALSLYNVKLYLISPDLLKLPERYIRLLEKNNVEYEIVKDYKECGKELDILYCTRIQKERFADPIEYNRVAGSYIIKSEDLKFLGKKTLIMHPLPRVDEIDEQVDFDPRAIYFKQAENGVYVRETLLGLISGSL